MGYVISAPILGPVDNQVTVGLTDVCYCCSVEVAVNSLQPHGK